MGAARARMRARPRRSYEGPALHYLDDEVLARRQRFVAVRRAALRTSQVQIPVQPYAKFTAETIQTSCHFFSSVQYQNWYDGMEATLRAGSIVDEPKLGDDIWNAQDRLTVLIKVLVYRPQIC